MSAADNINPHNQVFFINNTLSQQYLANVVPCCAATHPGGAATSNDWRHALALLTAN
jgi:hypothetical protein